MTIIRSKVSQDFTLIVNRVTEDKEFDSKYIGTFLRLISKGEGWEISAAGLASLYPTNGVEFYRNALKHMCKLGYLVKIPQPRHKGHFVKSVMELYDSRQIETPLDDKIVDKLFSIEDMTEEEIKIIYPQRVSRRGSAETVKHTKESKEEESIKKETTTTQKEKAVVVFPCLEKIQISQELKERLSAMRTEEELSVAVTRCLAWKSRANDEVGILAVLKKGEDWNDVDDPKEIEAKNFPFLQSLAKYDGTSIGPISITVGYRYIEFAGNMKSETFTIDQKDFIHLVNAYLQKLGRIH